MRGRARAYVALAAVLAALLMPPLWPPAEDSYPLSTYPMFSRDRGATSVVATVVGVDAEGRAHRLSPALIGGSAEPMQAVATAGRAARGTAADRRALCRRVADRVAAGGRDELVAVALRVETHDAVANVEGDPDRALAVEVLATCEVAR